jgi:hypothetical protein
MAVVLWGLVPACRADVVLEIESTLLLPGAASLVNVYASSTASESVQSFGLKVQISSSAVSGVLTFVDPQTYDTQAEADYLFAGNTNPANWASQVDVNFLTVTLGDFTADLGDMSLNSRRLLARLQVQHTTPHPNLTIGDIYSFSIVDDGTTYFSDMNGNLLNFSSGTGNVVIATPEPSSLWFITAGVLLTGWGLRKNSRRQAATSATCLSPVSKHEFVEDSRVRIK